MNLGFTSLHTVFRFTTNCVSCKIKFPVGKKRKQEKIYAMKKTPKTRKMLYIVRKDGLEALNELYIKRVMIFLN